MFFFSRDPDQCSQETLELCDFSGGGGGGLDLCPPYGSAHVSDILICVVHKLIFTRHEIVDRAENEARSSLFLFLFMLCQSNKRHTA